MKWTRGCQFSEFSVSYSYPNSNTPKGVSHGLLATSCLWDNEKGSCIYIFGEDGSVKMAYLKGVRDAIVSTSGEKVYIIDTAEGRIYAAKL